MEFKNMRQEDQRINLYCKLLGLTSRATAGRRINKSLNLKPYETFLSSLNNTDIQKIIDFVNGATSEIKIKIKKNKKTNAVKSFVYNTDKLVTVATVNGISYQAYKPINKDDEEILNEFEIQFEFSKRDEENEEKYREDVDYAIANFNKQTEYGNLEAYLEHVLGNHDLAFEREQEHRLTKVIEKPTGKLIENYGKYLYFRKIFEKYTEEVFKKEIASIDISNDLTKIIEDLFQIMHDNYNYTELNNNSKSSKTINNFLIKHIIYEKLLYLLEQYRVLYL